MAGQRKTPDLRIAVLSDLHAFKRGKDPKVQDQSRLCTSDPETNPGQHPFAGLRELIDKENLTAELVLCAGDMADRADPDGVRYVWERLHQFGDQLGSSLVTATAGNHDIDSRELTRADDPKEILQELTPTFPLKDVTLANEYWSRHVTIFNESRFRLVLLNSCSKHVNGANAMELERGAVSASTLNHLNKRLSGLSSPINILLCHHHPQAHSEYSLGETDVMRRGQLLLDLLASHGDWLVVHGHKHFPKLTYSAGGVGWPTVFAAGSFSGYFGAEAETRTRNQFHLIELYGDRDGAGALRGMVRSWYWASGSGWLPSAGKATGFPRVAGFGTRSTPYEVAQSIARAMKKSDIKSWSEVIKRVPAVQYQLPQDFDRMREILSHKFGLKIVETDGVPSEIGRSK